MFRDDCGGGGGGGWSLCARCRDRVGIFWVSRVGGGVTGYWSCWQCVVSTMLAKGSVTTGKLPPDDQGESDAPNE